MAKNSSIFIPPEGGNLYFNTFAKKVFTPQECKEIINSEGNFIQSAVYDRKEGHSLREESRFSKSKVLSPNSRTEWIFKRLETIIQASNESYFNFDIVSLQGTEVIKYEENDFFITHHDIGHGATSTRKLSMVVFLSDISDYEGGRLKFTPNFEFVPNQGSAIIFPSYIIHEVERITKGTRYTLVSWAHGPRFR